MRVVFMGTPEFAVPSLRALAASHEVVCVYTRPDAVSGRGNQTRPSPVGAAADELGLLTRKPKTLRDPVEYEALQLLEPDVVVVAAFGMILPREILEIPPLGCINVHASLLPRWRGAAPIQRAILAGDDITGVSIMRMEEGLDTGAFCEVETARVGDLDTSRLTDLLSHSGATAMVTALHHIEGGSAIWVDQDESDVTYAAKLSKDDVAISPDMPVATALRHIRASGPRTPVRVLVAGKGLTVVSASEGSEVLAQAGVAASAAGLSLGFSNGSIVAKRIKPDGKGEMAATDWARGARLTHDTTWESAR